MDQRRGGPYGVEGGASEWKVPHVRLDEREPAAPAPGVFQQQPGKIDGHNTVASPATVEMEEMPGVLSGPAPEIQNTRRGY